VREDIESTGTQVAFVHMATEAEADKWFARARLSDVMRISDPKKLLYHAFALEEASLMQLAHPRVWGRWLRTAVRQGAGFQGSDWRQLTGVFLIKDGTIMAEIRHRDSSARPNYPAFVRKGLSQGRATMR
jgi:alkyl-hydroperoxide reductase/thiol specific antioxidant family protein